MVTIIRKVPRRIGANLRLWPRAISQPPKSKISPQPMETILGSGTQLGMSFCIRSSLYEMLAAEGDEVEAEQK